MKRFVLAMLLALGCETETMTDDAGSGCGDGVVVIGESCDDANREDGDGCSAMCIPEEGWVCEGSPSECELMMPPPGRCGDGMRNEGEECDDGGESAACDLDCTDSRCGDGTLNVTRGEECDDANDADGDGCTYRCVDEPDTCGNFACQDGESCNNCPSDCSKTRICMECPDMDGDGATDSLCGGPDCNDFDANVRPGATEVTCNRVDEDCEPTTRDALDMDEDLSSCNFDCDDSDPDRHPLALEVCNNGLDDDCNAETPDLFDFDRDGVECTMDCDDYDAAVSPSADEICANAVDDDCNPATLDLFDADGDGASCEIDCDDADPMESPLRAEVCGNGSNDDCDATTPDTYDRDGDGELCTMDCDDRDPRRESTNTEICGNGVDDDCNDSTPELADRDGDGSTCDVDCDDASAASVPDALNRCGARFAYVQSFDTDNGGWTTSGTSSSWQHGRPAATFIDAAASGPNAWVTNLTGNYNNNEMSFLISPVFDMGAITEDPTLRFSHIFRTDSADDGWVEVTTDGVMWRKLGRDGEGRNWYNDAADDVWNGMSGMAGVWRTAEHVLTGTAGSATVQIRFVFRSNASTVNEGFGVDDVWIENEYIDLGAISAGIPETTCASATHPIAITVRNDGVVPVSRYDVSYSIDGGTTVVETVNETLLPGQIATHLFASRADLAMLGMHAIQARVTAMGDTATSNDAISATFAVENAPFVVLGEVYVEDFEGGPGGFTASGVNSTWQHGSPGGFFVRSAASGENAWATGLTVYYEDDELSYVTSPCFDFSAATIDPTLSFAHIYETENTYDFGRIEILTGVTRTWQTLGARGSGTNWYNATNGWTNTSGASGVWRTASHRMTGTAGLPVVRFRHVMDSDSAGFFPNDYDGFGLDRVVIRR